MCATSLFDAPFLLFQVLLDLMRYVRNMSEFMSSFPLRCAKSDRRSKVLKCDDCGYVTRSKDFMLRDGSYDGT